MKSILALAILGLSFNLFADASEGTVIEIPYSTPNLYVGTISRLESKIRNQLVQKAIEICGTKENISLLDKVEVKFRFGALELDNTVFEGSYPVASAKGVVYCY